MKYYTLLLGILLLSGCATWTYTMECKGTKVTAQSQGIAYTRAIDALNLTSTECGSATVTGAKTDTEKAWEAGIQAGKEIGKAAAGLPK